MNLPDYAEELFQPHRYKVLLGGRGSAKSYTVARALLLRGIEKKRRVLCARELQNSIKESVHKLLSDQIEAMGVKKKYTVTNDRIMGTNGTEFIFKGVHHNVDSIKSMAGLTDLWIEEAHILSQRSWDILVPTIREPNSEIWVTYNPENEDDPTHKKFVINEPPPGSYVQKVNWRDNPWFPEVLRDEMIQLKRVNPDLHAHVWEGECRSHSDAQIFKNKWEIRDFKVDPAWDGPYFGADWGFSVDPLALVKIYLDMSKRIIYFREETGGTGIEMDDINKQFDKVSESKNRVIRADNSRPETISYVARHGHNCQAALKWKGSVEDGIEWMKGFNKIVIHPSCKETGVEFRKYSYKIDRLTGDITVDIVDAYNHYIDAARYALEPLISAGRFGILSCL